MEKQPPQQRKPIIQVLDAFLKKERPKCMNARPQAFIFGWASKGNVTITPCHPSYMALAFYHGGTYTRKYVRPFAGHAKSKDNMKEKSTSLLV